MRTFQTLDEAFQEIERDVYKGIPTKSSRVQQRLEEHTTRERMGYEYTIMDGWPQTPCELVDWAIPRLPFWKAHHEEITRWIRAEMDIRLNASHFLPNTEQIPDRIHPALKSTFEGNWPSYTYAERLMGMEPALKAALIENKDTRRAFWPIFRPEDAIRSVDPTRVPCSLGYQFIVRNLRGSDRLLMFYLSRSVDFDTFWLSDIWLARQIQQKMAFELNLEPGYLSHFIISFHSFNVDGEEIY